MQRICCEAINAIDRHLVRGTLQGREAVTVTTARKSQPKPKAITDPQDRYLRPMRSSSSMTDKPSQIAPTPAAKASTRNQNQAVANIYIPSWERASAVLCGAAVHTLREECRRL